MIGGSVSISAGSSDGQSENDHGGSLNFSAGNANGGVGGSIDVVSGGSNYESSMLFVFTTLILVYAMSYLTSYTILVYLFCCRWSYRDSIV